MVLPMMPDGQAVAPSQGSTPRAPRTPRKTGRGGRPASPTPSSTSSVEQDLTQLLLAPPPEEKVVAELTPSQQAAEYVDTLREVLSSKPQTLDLAKKPSEVKGRPVADDVEASLMGSLDPVKPPQTYMSQGEGPQERVVSAEQNMKSVLGSFEKAPAPTTGYPMGRGAMYAVANQRLNTEQQEQFDSVAAALEDALRMKREFSIGEKLGDQEFKAVKIKKKLDVITQEEYDQMTPLQRGAIEFNTQLVEAVRKDRKWGDDFQIATSEKEGYEEKLKEIFGKDESLEDAPYSPATVDLLQSISFEDTDAALSDFLRLKASVKNKDLKNLAPSDVAGGSHAAPEFKNPYTQERVELSRDLAEGTVDTYVQQKTDLAISLLVQKDTDIDMIMDALRTDLSPGQLASFEQSLVNFANDGEKYGPATAQEGIEYRSPSELLKIALQGKKEVAANG